MSNFLKYSAYYDLLYQDKDYEAEARYVAQLLHQHAPAATTILELGSGTGRHGRLLAGLGFEVQGIERSPNMVDIATLAPVDGPGAFTSQVGDICAFDLDRSFDAVIALFHVISYQATNNGLRRAFQAASRHLEPGGLFMFDVWHGPAVLSQEPEQRTKSVANDRHRVRRQAIPKLDTQASTVEVLYRIEGEDIETGVVDRFEEAHLLRYLFPTEIELLAQAAGFEVVASEEFLTGAAPSQETWGVNYLLRRSNRP